MASELIRNDLVGVQLMIVNLCGILKNNVFKKGEKIYDNLQKAADSNKV